MRKEMGKEDLKQGKTWSISGRVEGEKENNEAMKRRAWPNYTDWKAILSSEGMRDEGEERELRNEKETDELYGGRR